MIAFAFYIRFARVALELERQRERNAWRFATITPYIILLYILFNTWLVNSSDYGSGYLVAKISIRCYLLVMGFFILTAIKPLIIILLIYLFIFMF
jgi:hypothetical protein